ncbi:hypothetical protein IV203_024927 [Nitzschia inconspicua]|uniref:Uncharacterized protein n=1 Tax=Nitzschia inconspicua TaxID=303405 RepID=A0A9K3KAA8_9STRA|nr:hypothetical protein IV203_024927 [Nitzschia inconspicua]
MMRHHLSLDAMQMTYVLKYMRKLCIPSEKMQSVLDELEYFGFADADRRKDRLYDGIPDGDFPWSYKYSLFDMRAGDIDEDHYERLYTRHFMLQMSRDMSTMFLRVCGASSMKTKHIGCQLSWINQSTAHPARSGFQHQIVVDDPAKTIDTIWNIESWPSCYIAVGTGADVDCEGNRPTIHVHFRQLMSSSDDFIFDDLPIDQYLTLKVAKKAVNNRSDLKGFYEQLRKHGMKCTAGTYDDIGYPILSF